MTLRTISSIEGNRRFNDVNWVTKNESYRRDNSLLGIDILIDFRGDKAGVRKRETPGCRIGEPNSFMSFPNLQTGV